MARFIHTADWQLGFRRSFLEPDARARFAQARIDVIDTIAAVARDRGAQFVIVAGDVFESNAMDRRTVHRALDRLAAMELPVLLLPGNHDPLDASSIYSAASFLERCPDHVTVLRDGEARQISDGIEVVGIPWMSNELLHDAVGARLDALPPASPGVTRIVVGHGVVDRLQIDPHEPGVIDTQRVEQAIADNRLHYLALGDRHSTTAIGSSGRIWYAGAPEPTRFTEIDAGNVLCVDVSPTHCDVERIRVAAWRFAGRELEVNSDRDVENLSAWLEAVEDPARTIVRLRLDGVVPLRTMARLQEELELAAERFGCLDVVGLRTDLVAVADDHDIADLDAGPVTLATAAELSAMVTAGGPDAATAAAALSLLYRIARRAA